MDYRHKMQTYTTSERKHWGKSYQFEDEFVNTTSKGQ